MDVSMQQAYRNGYRCLKQHHSACTQCHAVLCHAMLCHAVCYAMLCAMPRYAIPSEDLPANANVCIFVLFYLHFMREPLSVCACALISIHT